jgi:glucose/arabinose dehydrogenase
MRFKPRLFGSLLAIAMLAGCASGPEASNPLSSDTNTRVPVPTSLPPTDAPTPTAPNVAQPTAEASPPPAEPAPTSAPVASLDQLNLSVQQLDTTFESPVYLTTAPGIEELFVVEKAGRVIVFDQEQSSTRVYLDITDRVESGGSEQGLLSVAFHPQFPQKNWLFVNYTDENGDTVVSRYTADAERADADSEMVLLNIEQPYRNHNGGQIDFGPDGNLYIGMGDGGSGGDPQGHAQNLQSLLGKILRINVDQGEPYTIPYDNPWADGADGRPEIWAWGLRNPWRFSFDSVTGDLYVADVGQNTYEEINRQPFDRAGVNYGWNITEGNDCFRSKSCDTDGLAMPIGVYDHSEGCSVTGGYVYRGEAVARLQGTYLFGDYCSGNVWGLRPTATNQWEMQKLLETDINISSFGRDHSGELYLLDLNGAIYRLTSN